jgi:hypothetical protein
MSRQPWPGIRRAWLLKHCVWSCPASGHLCLRCTDSYALRIWAESARNYCRPFKCTDIMARVSAQAVLIDGIVSYSTIADAFCSYEGEMRRGSGARIGWQSTRQLNYQLRHSTEQINAKTHSLCPRQRTTICKALAVSKDTTVPGFGQPAPAEESQNGTEDSNERNSESSVEMLAWVLVMVMIHSAQ